MMLTKPKRIVPLHLCFAVVLVGTWIVGCQGGARPTPSAVRNTDDVRDAVESILATPTVRPSPTLHPSRQHGQTDEHHDNQGFFEPLVTGVENVAETVYNRTAEIFHTIANETSTLVNTIAPVFSQQGVEAAANATSSLIQNYTSMTPSEMASNASSLVESGLRNMTSGIPVPGINANISDFIPVTPSPAPTQNPFERAMEYLVNITGGANVTYRHCGPECSYYNKSLTRSCRAVVERRDDNLWCTLKNKTSGRHEIEGCCGKYSDCCVPHVINISIITVLGGLVLVMLPILIAKMVHNRKQEQEGLKHRRLEEDEPQHSRL